MTLVRAHISTKLTVVVRFGTLKLICLTMTYWTYDGVMFFDTYLPFGSRHGTQMHHDSFDVINYVNVFVAFDIPTIAQCF